MKPRLLDLFCCEGGAAVGYARAGFDVEGVDIDDQPLYPFTFHQGDAIEYLLSHGDEFDAVHASPPCQKWTSMGNRKRLEWPDLIAPTRAALGALGKPYVIENVVGARNEMRHPFILHGGIFNLGVDRPRLFEINWPLAVLPMGPRARNPVGVYGERPDGRRITTKADGTAYRAVKGVEAARVAMGMPWASWNGLREAIPPAYTEWIGTQLLEHLAVAA